MKGIVKVNMKVINLGRLWSNFLAANETVSRCFY